MLHACSIAPARSLLALKKPRRRLRSEEGSLASGFARRSLPAAWKPAKLRTVRRSLRRRPAKLRTVRRSLRRVAPLRASRHQPNGLVPLRSKHSSGVASKRLRSLRRTLRVSLSLRAVPRTAARYWRRNGLVPQCKNAQSAGTGGLPMRLHGPPPSRSKVRAS